MIHVIGDSHVAFFSGKDWYHNLGFHPQWPPYIGENDPFKTYFCGASLAGNLQSFKTSSGGRNTLESLLNSVIPRGSNILLSYGEIDCRVHLVKQAESQNRPVRDITKECINKYFDIIKNIKGFRVGIWGVPPGKETGAIPTSGDVVTRNKNARYFNNYLNDLCKSENIIFLSIFEQLINSDLTPKPEFFLDNNHLNQKAFPLIEAKIKKAYNERT